MEEPGPVAPSQVAWLGMRWVGLLGGPPCSPGAARPGQGARSSTFASFGLRERDLEAWWARRRGERQLRRLLRGGGGAEPEDEDDWSEEGP